MPASSNNSNTTMLLDGKEVYIYEPKRIWAAVLGAVFLWAWSRGNNIKYSLAAYPESSMQYQV